MIVGVLVAVAVLVGVGVTVGVLVIVAVDVIVAVSVGVLVGLGVGVEITTPPGKALWKLLIPLTITVVPTWVQIPLVKLQVAKFPAPKDA